MPAFDGRFVERRPTTRVSVTIREQGDRWVASDGHVFRSAAEVNVHYAMADRESIEQGVPVVRIIVWEPSTTHGREIVEAIIGERKTSA